VNTIIKVENLSKAYQLGQIGTGTISKDIHRWWTTRIRGQEDPFLKIGETNDRSVKGESDVVWSLKDINFEINQGDAVGIIGRNGAGKSTLLKLLSRVTAPTTGNIKVKGRIASLLEVGTGFHPELTGRENIYLNGAILGMRKKEITRKFDEIVDFSGVERYIDTPVKRYSSGMYVRLAFAVAAHLESEILIVDEVLAVGDAEFQKKCLGKMGDVSSNEGRTVLFVSHNMAAVKDLCLKSILLKNGSFQQFGRTNSVIQEYLHSTVKISSGSDFLNDPKRRRGNGEVRFLEISINGSDNFINPEKEINIKMTIQTFQPVNSIYGSISVLGSASSESITNTGLFCIKDGNIDKNIQIEFNINIPPNFLRTGLYPLYLWLGKPKEIMGDPYPFDVVDSLYYLNIISDNTEKNLGYNPNQPNGYFNLEYNLSEIKVQKNVK
jgi:lipopolysaccharide transport system ATP-binding protein